MKFPSDVCQACPVNAKCTTAIRGGRQLTLRPRLIQQALDAARAEQVTTDWQRRYARRAGVESTIAPSDQGHRQPTHPLPRTAQNPSGT